VLVKPERRTRVRWLALAGGIFGAGAGFALAAGTAWLYPLRTGDKPIIALYPAAIITFELAMLFAMVATVAGMFLEMRLPRREKGLYDPAIAEGCIGISVTIHPGGGAVLCGRSAGPGECIGTIAVLPAAEQQSRAAELMQAAGNGQNERHIVVAILTDRSATKPAHSHRLLFTFMTFHGCSLIFR
jgi:hypothetical protein